jgi:hypothetical protein
MTHFKTITVKELHPTFAAEVEGVDFENLSDEQLQEILAAMAKVQGVLEKPLPPMRLHSTVSDDLGSTVSVSSATPVSTTTPTSTSRDDWVSSTILGNTWWPGANRGTSITSSLMRAMSMTRGMCWIRIVRRHCFSGYVEIHDIILI